MSVPQGEITAPRLALWTMVLWLGWTMVVIPYYAWVRRLPATITGHRRTRIATWRTLLGVTGVLAALALALVSAELFGYGGEVA